ncbi:MAG: hypothetical protein J3K34DRAFT_405175 [Monoraphidium minutum]|nr:MAG: hypothetical protein J3K34DRAFT_405175 [Monoraphidium minutum]
MAAPCLSALRPFRPPQPIAISESCGHRRRARFPHGCHGDGAPPQLPPPPLMRAAGASTLVRALKPRVALGRLSARKDRPRHAWRGSALQHAPLPGAPFLLPPGRALHWRLGPKGEAGRRVALAAGRICASPLALAACACRCSCLGGPARPAARTPAPTHANLLLRKTPAYYTPGLHAAATNRLQARTPLGRRPALCLPPHTQLRLCAARSLRAGTPCAARACVAAHLPPFRLPGYQ